MEIKKGYLEGALVTVLCVITGALGFVTAQKVDEIKNLKEELKSAKYVEVVD